MNRKIIIIVATIIVLLFCSITNLIISRHSSAHNDNDCPSTSSNNILETTETEHVEHTQPEETIQVTEPTEPVETTVVTTEATMPTEEKTETNLVSMGEFKLTAYCSCNICCGIWAENRPKDEYGNDIVYGASGERLTAGVSVAVDPSVIPYCSKVVVNGHTYTAHDTGSAVKGNHIDIYFDSHEEAYNFGLQYAELFLVIE